jgi:hypothetical protein
MKRLKMKLFTLADSWPWALATAIITFMVTLAVRYGVLHGFDPVGLTILGVVAATFFLLFLARYLIRAKYIDEWNDAFQCKVGCAVISRDIPNVKYWLIDEELSKTAKYWLDIARSPTFFDVCKVNAPGWVNNDQAIYKLENSLAYKSIFVVKGPIELYNPYFMAKLAGMVDLGGNIVVSGDDPNRLIALVRHEASHVFLSALGIPAGPNGDENHHRIFQELGYC